MHVSSKKRETLIYFIRYDKLPVIHAEAIAFAEMRRGGKGSVYRRIPYANGRRCRSIQYPHNIKSHWDCPTQASADTFGGGGPKRFPR